MLVYPFARSEESGQEEMGMPEVPQVCLLLITLVCSSSRGEEYPEYKS